MRVLGLVVLISATSPFGNQASSRSCNTSLHRQSAATVGLLIGITVSPVPTVGQ